MQDLSMFEFYKNLEGPNSWSEVSEKGLVGDGRGSGKRLFYHKNDLTKSKPLFWAETEMVQSMQTFWRVKFPLHSVVAKEEFSLKEISVDGKQIKATEYITGGYFAIKADDSLMRYIKYEHWVFNYYKAIYALRTEKDSKVEFSKEEPFIIVKFNNYYEFLALCGIMKKHGIVKAIVGMKNRNFLLRKDSTLTTISEKIYFSEMIISYLKEFSGYADVSPFSQTSKEIIDIINNDKLKHKWQVVSSKHNHIIVSIIEPDYKVLLEKNMPSSRSEVTIIFTEPIYKCIVKIVEENIKCYRHFFEKPYTVKYENLKEYRMLGDFLESLIGIGKWSFEGKVAVFWAIYKNNKEKLISLGWKDNDLKLYGDTPILANQNESETAISVEQFIKEMNGIC